ncbi:MAG: signal peptidase II [bacterium]|nr:signal peptidase II [bacterium]
MKSFYSASLIALGADQISKVLIRFLVPAGRDTGYPVSWLTIYHINNNGAAFGLLHGMGWLLLPFTVLTVAAVIYAAFKYRQLALPLGFIAGGALGNAVDRVCRGVVTDFICLPYWPVFNLADVFITAGALLLALRVMKPEIEVSARTRS